MKVTHFKSNGTVVEEEIPDVVLTQKEHNQNNVEMLKNWFDTVYTKNEQKYRRLHTLKKLCDDGSSPLEKLYDLYDEAEDKRREIQRLEQGVAENGTLYDNTL